MFFYLQKNVIGGVRLYQKTEGVHKPLPSPFRFTKLRKKIKKQGRIW